MNTIEERLDYLLEMMHDKDAVIRDSAVERLMKDEELLPQFQKWISFLRPNLKKSNSPATYFNFVARMFLLNIADVTDAIIAEFDLNFFCGLISRGSQQQIIDASVAPSSFGLFVEGGLELAHAYLGRVFGDDKLEGEALSMCLKNLKLLCLDLQLQDEIYEGLLENLDFVREKLVVAEDTDVRVQALELVVAVNNNFAKDLYRDIMEQSIPPKGATRNKLDYRRWFAALLEEIQSDRYPVQVKSFGRNTLEILSRVQAARYEICQEILQNQLDKVLRENQELMAYVGIEDGRMTPFQIQKVAAKMRAETKREQAFK